MALSAVTAPRQPGQGWDRAVPAMGSPERGCPPSPPPPKSRQHVPREGVPIPSSGCHPPAMATAPHPTRSRPGHLGWERAPGMPRPSPASPSHQTPVPREPLTHHAESRERRRPPSLLSPVKPSKSSCCPSPPIISNAAQVDLGAAQLHLSGARVPSEGTQVGGRSTHMESTGIWPWCHQSCPPAYTQAVAGGLEIYIGYRGGRKGSSGARAAPAPCPGAHGPS